MARGISTILTAVIFGAIGFGLGIYAAPTEGVANLKAAIEGRFQTCARRGRCAGRNPGDSSRVGRDRPTRRLGRAGA